MAKKFVTYNKDQFYPNIVCPFIGLLKDKKLSLFAEHVQYEIRAAAFSFEWPHVFIVFPSTLGN